MAAFQAVEPVWEFVMVEKCWKNRQKGGIHKHILDHPLKLVLFMDETIEDVDTIGKSPCRQCPQTFVKEPL